MCLPGPGVSNFTLLVQLTGVLVSLWCVDSLGRRPLHGDLAESLIDSYICKHLS